MRSVNESAPRFGYRRAFERWLLGIWLVAQVASPLPAAESANPAADKAASRAPTGRLTVAIATFQNRTGLAESARWGNFADRLLRQPLSEVKTIRLAPGVEWALGKLGKQDGDPLDETEARQLGELIEARRVVWGSCERQGNQWRVTVRVLNVATGQASPPLTAASDDLFEVRDRLTERVLRELGITPAETERSKMSRRSTTSAKVVDCLVKASASAEAGGMYPELEKDVRGAVAADPQCAEACVALGAILFTQGRMPDAEKESRRAIELRADYARAHLLLGVALLLQKNYDEAEAELRAASRLDPDDAETFVWLGDVYEHQEWLLRAVINYGFAIALDPYDAGTHAKLAAVYARQQNREKARAALAQAERLMVVKASPVDEMNALQMLCNARAELKDFPAAIDYAEKYVAAGRKMSANPKLVDAFEARARGWKARLQPAYVEAATPRRYDEDSLQATLRQQLTAAELARVTDPLARTAAMDRWARELTRDATNDLQEAQRLFDALSQHLDRQEAGGTRTARQVFDEWDKPRASFFCQEYARLYVALARAVGLPAFYAGVSEDFTGELVFHACAAIFVDGRFLLVDPAYAWFGVPHKKFTLMDDLQAVANHLNQSDDLELMRIAIKLDPQSLYSRERYVQQLMKDNRWDEARRELTALVLREDKDSYVYLLQGRLALHDGNPKQAVQYLLSAIDLKPDVGCVHVTLGEAYCGENQWAKAREACRTGLRFSPCEMHEDAARRTIAQVNERLGKE